MCERLVGRCGGARRRRRGRLRPPARSAHCGDCGALLWSDGERPVELVDLPALRCCTPGGAARKMPGEPDPRSRRRGSGQAAGRRARRAVAARSKTSLHWHPASWGPIDADAARISDVFALGLDLRVELRASCSTVRGTLAHCVTWSMCLGVLDLSGQRRATRSRSRTPSTVRLANRRPRRGPPGKPDPLSRARGCQRRIYNGIATPKRPCLYDIDEQPGRSQLAQDLQDPGESRDTDPLRAKPNLVNEPPSGVVAPAKGPLDTLTPT